MLTRPATDGASVFTELGVRTFCLCVSQFMVVGPVGPIGFSVLVHVSVAKVLMSSFPPECDIVLVRAPPLPTTQCHSATIAPETSTNHRTAANSPTVQVREQTDQVTEVKSGNENLTCSDWLSLQWMAAGGRGLHLGRVPSPVGRGFGYLSGSAISLPLNMAVESVTGRALGAASVRVSVPVTPTISR